MRLQIQLHQPGGRLIGGLLYCADNSLNQVCSHAEWSDGNNKWKLQDRLIQPLAFVSSSLFVHQEVTAMGIWIGLFRGINVGGNNILPMAELRRDLESLNFKNVQTYIQSGNVVFESSIRTSSTLAKKIGTKVEEQHGFRPQVLLIKKENLQSAIDANPYPQASKDPKSVHFLFLEKPAKKPDLEALEEIKSKTESFHLTDQVFYFHAPDGIARSKLAAKAEKCLGVVATGRNFRTVQKLLEMTS